MLRAIACQSVDIVEELLQHGADPAQEYTEGYYTFTALLHAVMFRNKDYDLPARPRSPAPLLRGCANYPCALRMAKALWEFAWLLRHHAEAVVRRGVLVALCAVAQACRPAALLHDLEIELPELQEWLKQCAAHEADAGCQQLAVACHQLFGSSVRAEMALGPALG